MSVIKHKLFRYLVPVVGAVVAGLMISNYATGKGVVTIMNNKGLPPATISVIDPEGGTSGGTTGAEVNLAVNDVILFRFQVTPAPDGIPFGINHYLTEYVPTNLQVVGVRLTDEDGNTIKPNLPGRSYDGCNSGSCNEWDGQGSSDPLPCTTGGSCSGGERTDVPAGSVAQSYGDTGVFYTFDSRVLRRPDQGIDPTDNFLRFLSLTTGLVDLEFDTANKEPAEVSPTFDGALGIGSTWFAHNFWDMAQVQALGANGSVSVTGGKGNPPHLYGSPVAGPHTGYPYEVSYGAGDPFDPLFDDVDGPWLRARYPGSHIAGPLAGDLGTGGEDDVRRAQDYGNYNLDITPLTPMPGSGGVVRVATGALAVGRPVFVEVAAKVTSGFDSDLALDSQFGNVNCGEIFGGGGNADLVWPYFAPDAQCTILRAVIDVTANDPLATGSNVPISFDVDIRNLAVETDQNVVLRVQNNQGREMTYTGATVTSTEGSCTTMDTSQPCDVISVGDLAPNDELNFVVNTFSGGQGAETLFLKVNYTSDGGTTDVDALPAPGFTSQDISQVRLVGVPTESLTWIVPNPDGHVDAGSVASFTGTMENDGVDSLDYEGITLYLPSGWTVQNGEMTVNGQPASCTGGSTPFCSFDVSLAPGAGIVYSFSVVTDGGSATDVYAIDAEFEVRLGSLGASSVYNRDFVEVAVNEIRSDAPVIDCGALTTASTEVSGTTEEGAGTEVCVYVNLVQRGTCYTVQSGDCDQGVCNWTVDVGSDFGTLYTGVEVVATAEAPGENVSVFSASCAVTTTRQCSDGINNDTNGVACVDDTPCTDPDFPVCDTEIGECAEDLFIDFPADPGCASPNDNGEAPNLPVAECADTIDNEDSPDGDIDFGEDYQCYGPDDDDETGAGQCSDGIDNDGDGLCDTSGCTIDTVSLPADPACADNDPNYESERDYYQCNNGIDDDGDGDGIDFPDDPDCHSYFDNDESDPAQGSDIIKPRILVIFDTSGSMNNHVCALPPPDGLETDFTGGDGSYECTGSDVACAVCDPGGTGTTCDNTFADDSRLFKVKEGISDVVASFGDVEYGLMRFKQRPQEFGCPGTDNNFGSGAWLGGGVEPCTPFDEGEVVVDFAPDNVQTYLGWMDHESNYPQDPITAPYGLDFELRGTGSTPLAGALDSARQFIYDQISTDPAQDCRPYRIILVTDGLESCGGVPETVAAEIFDPTGTAYDGERSIPVSVIGFASGNTELETGLNDIALAGSGNAEGAIIVSDEAALSNAIAEIVSESIVTEVCDGIDNDCDDLVDETFTLGGTCNNGAEGTCFLEGTVRCDPANDRRTVCCADPDSGTPPAGTPETNVCNSVLDPDGNPDPDEGTLCNNQDDDCDGLIDEGLDCNCIGYELCDNSDNDCDGQTDEDVLVDTVVLCSVDGDCDTDNGFTCQDVPSDLVPAPSTLAKACYNGSTYQAGSCLESLDGIGICQAGTVTCDTGSIVCSGGVPPEDVETCDGQDENCNNVSDGDELGRGCYTGESEVVAGETTKGCDPNDLGDCLGQCRPGFQTCVETSADMWEFGYDADGEGTGDFGNAGQCFGQVTPQTEECNNLDDDCDGSIDEGFPVGDICNNGNDGICYREGTLQCNMAGDGVVCNAPNVTPQTEVCDDVDNDCDGATDEEPLPIITVTCSQDSDCDEENGYACGDGGDNPDLCYNPDADPDTGGNQPDYENIACGTGACGGGTFQCVEGGVTCVGQPPQDGTEVCNGEDDDCDTLIDEDFPEEGADCVPDGNAPDGRPYSEIGDTGECEFGDTVCLGGELSCANYKGPSEEICNGLDDDCDGEVDDMASCEGADEICLEGECVAPCLNSEFPCSFGFYCEEVPEEGKFCLPDPCVDITCDPGSFCESSTGECVDLCGDVQCIDGAFCQDGFCLDCFTVPCPDGEICRPNMSGVGVCEEDLCADVTCDTEAGEFCVEGECRTTNCEGGCADDEICVNGACEDDPCDGVECGRNQICRPTDGECVRDNLCEEIECFSGEVCDPGTGDCIADPCLGIECPEGTGCFVDGPGLGVCREPKGDRVFAGGRGTGCAAGGDAGTTSGMLLMLGLFGLIRRRRRRRD